LRKSCFFAETKYLGELASKATFDEFDIFITGANTIITVEAKAFFYER